jgi:hypothetical protein
MFYIMYIRLSTHIAGSRGPLKRLNQYSSVILDNIVSVDVF